MFMGCICKNVRKTLYIAAEITQLLRLWLRPIWDRKGIYLIDVTRVKGCAPLESKGSTWLSKCEGKARRKFKNCACRFIIRSVKCWKNAFCLDKRTCKIKTRAPRLWFFSSEAWIRTKDLRVMSQNPGSVPFVGRGLQIGRPDEFRSMLAGHAAVANRFSCSICFICVRQAIFG